MIGMAAKRAGERGDIVEGRALVVLRFGTVAHWPDRNSGHTSGSNLRRTTFGGEEETQALQARGITREYVLHGAFVEGNGPACSVAGIVQQQFIHGAIKPVGIEC